MSVEFQDFRIEVKGAIEDKAKRWLTEASNEIMSQAIENTVADSGQLKGSWSTVVGETDAVIGNSAEHAIYNEFGTGEYAAEGNGRRGGWVYPTGDGKVRFTYGMKPRRMLFNAYRTKKAAVINLAKQIFRELG